MDEIVIDILEDLRVFCSHCGQCCTDELFFLADIEHSTIARHLFDLGGYDLVRNHIRKNPTVFNIWSQYLYHFAGECPFRKQNRCSNYDDHPLSCRVYPFRLFGIFDNENMELRTPFFAFQRGKRGYACNQRSNQLIDKMNELSRMNPQLGMYAQKLLVVSMLNEPLLGYCFGQTKQRGVEYINTAGLVFRNEMDVSGFIHSKFFALFDLDPSKDWVEHCETLSDDDIDRLISDLHQNKARRKTSKRMKNLKRYDNTLLEWHWKHPILQ